MDTQAVHFFSGMIFKGSEMVPPTTTRQFVVTATGLDVREVTWNQYIEECFAYILSSAMYVGDRIYFVGGVKVDSDNGKLLNFGGLSDRICMFDLATRNVQLLEQRLSSGLMGSYMRQSE